MNEKTQWMLFGFVALIAIGGLVLSISTEKTGYLAKSGMYPYPSTYRMIPQDNPCSILSCSFAYPVGEDEFGNTICQCPQHSEPYFKISGVRSR